MIVCLKKSSYDQSPMTQPTVTGSRSRSLWAEPAPYHSGMDTQPSSLWAEPAPHHSGMDSTLSPPPPQTPLTLPPHPTSNIFSTHTPSPLSRSLFSDSISPIPTCSPSPISTNSYILNDDNSFALPLIVMNDTYVFTKPSPF